MRSVSAAFTFRNHRDAGDLNDMVFVLTFVAGALCGLFAAGWLSSGLSETLTPPQLSSCGELRTLAALAWLYSLTLLCATVRLLRPAAFCLCGFLCAACGYCAAMFWRTWGNAGFYLSCWLLLPRLLLLGALVPLLRMKPNILAVLAAPALFAVQFLLYPVFSLSFTQMI